PPPPPLRPYPPLFRSQGGGRLDRGQRVRLCDDRPELIERSPALVAAGQVLLERVTFRGVECAIQIVRELLHVPVAHAPPHIRCSRSVMRARCNCDFDVPAVMHSISAISSCL